jgi:hypothetical protein
MGGTGLNRQPLSSFSATTLDDVAAIPGFHFFTETMRAKTFDIGLIGQILFHRAWIITYVRAQSRNKKASKKLLQWPEPLDIMSLRNHR